MDDGDLQELVKSARIACCNEKNNYLKKQLTANSYETKEEFDAKRMELEDEYEKMHSMAPEYADSEIRAKLKASLCFTTPAGDFKLVYFDSKKSGQTVTFQGRRLLADMVQKIFDDGGEFSAMIKAADYVRERKRMKK